MKKLLLNTLFLVVSGPLLQAGDGENLVANGNFDVSETSWEVAYREPELGAITVESDEAPAGAGFVRLTPLNSSSSRALAFQNKLNQVGPGRYKLKGWIRVSDDYAARMPVVSVGWRNADSEGESGAASLTLDEMAAPGEWIFCEKEVEIPDGAEGTYVFLFAYGSVGHADFDGIALEPLP